MLTPDWRSAIRTSAARSAWVRGTCRPPDSGVVTGSSPSSRRTTEAAVATSAWSASRSWRVELPTDVLSSSGVPSATLTPRSMTAIRSASWSASSRYCVVSSTVQPSATSERMVSHIWPRVRGSRPVVGSSRKISGGRVMRLAARSSRRRMPPENFEIGLSAADCSPNCSSSSPVTVRARPDGRPWSRPNSQRFSRAVRFSSTEAYWPVTPTSWRTTCGSRRTSTPKIEASPASMGSRVASIRSIVVLPAPLGPRTPKISPRCTSRSMWSTARTSSKVLTRPAVRTARSGCRFSFMTATLPRAGFTPVSPGFHRTRTHGRPVTEGMTGRPRVP